MSEENETLRWPTNLDRIAIVRRLVAIRAAAEAGGVAELVTRFAGIEEMTSGEIGAHVIGALNWIQDKPEHGALAQQLAMVAMNLKNLK